MAARLFQQIIEEVADQVIGPAEDDSYSEYSSEYSSSSGGTYSSEEESRRSRGRGAGGSDSRRREGRREDHGRGGSSSGRRESGREGRRSESRGSEGGRSDRERRERERRRQRQQQLYGSGGSNGNGHVRRSTSQSSSGRAKPPPGSSNGGSPSQNPRLRKSSSRDSSSRMSGSDHHRRREGDRERERERERSRNNHNPRQSSQSRHRPPPNSVLEESTLGESTYQSNRSLQSSTLNTLSEDGSASVSHRGHRSVRRVGSSSDLRRQRDQERGREKERERDREQELQREKERDRRRREQQRQHQQHQRQQRDQQMQIQKQKQRQKQQQQSMSRAASEAVAAASRVRMDQRTRPPPSFKVVASDGRNGSFSFDAEDDEEGTDGTLTRAVEENMRRQQHHEGQQQQLRNHVARSGERQRELDHQRQKRERRESLEQLLQKSGGELVVPVPSSLSGAGAGPLAPPPPITAAASEGRQQQHHHPHPQLPYPNQGPADGDDEEEEVSYLTLPTALAGIDGTASFPSPRQYGGVGGARSPTTSAVTMSLIHEDQIQMQLPPHPLIRTNSNASGRHAWPCDPTSAQCAQPPTRRAMSVDEYDATSARPPSSTGAAVVQPRNVPTARSFDVGGGNGVNNGALPPRPSMPEQKMIEEAQQLLTPYYNKQDASGPLPPPPPPPPPPPGPPPSSQLTSQQQQQQDHYLHRTNPVSPIQNPVSMTQYPTGSYIQSAGAIPWPSDTPSNAKAVPWPSDNPKTVAEKALSDHMSQRSRAATPSPVPIVVTQSSEQPQRTRAAAPSPVPIVMVPSSEQHHPPAQPSHQEHTISPKSPERLSAAVSPEPKSNVNGVTAGAPIEKNPSNDIPVVKQSRSGDLRKAEATIREVIRRPPSTSSPRSRKNAASIQKTLSIDWAQDLWSPCDEDDNDKPEEFASPDYVPYWHRHINSGNNNGLSQQMRAGLHGVIDLDEELPIVMRNTVEDSVANINIAQASEGGEANDFADYDLQDELQSPPAVETDVDLTPEASESTFDSISDERGQEPSMIGQSMIENADNAAPDPSMIGPSMIGATESQDSTEEERRAPDPPSTQELLVENAISEDPPTSFISDEGDDAIPVVPLDLQVSGCDLDEEEEGFEVFHQPSHDSSYAHEHVNISPARSALEYSLEDDGKDEQFGTAGVAEVIVPEIETDLSKPATRSPPDSNDLLLEFNSATHIQRLVRGVQARHRVLAEMGIAKRRKWEPRTKTKEQTRIHSDMRRAARDYLRHRILVLDTPGPGSMALAVRRVCAVKIQRWFKHQVAFYRTVWKSINGFQAIARGFIQRRRYQRMLQQHKGKAKRNDSSSRLESFLSKKENAAAALQHQQIGAGKISLTEESNLLGVDFCPTVAESQYSLEESNRVVLERAAGSEIAREDASHHGVVSKGVEVRDNSPSIAEGEAAKSTVSPASTTKPPLNAFSAIIRIQSWFRSTIVRKAYLNECRLRYSYSNDQWDRKKAGVRRRILSRVPNSASPVLNGKQGRGHRSLKYELDPDEQVSIVDEPKTDLYTPRKLTQRDLGQSPDSMATAALTDLDKTVGSSRSSSRNVSAGSVPDYCVSDNFATPLRGKGAANATQSPNFEGPSISMDEVEKQRAAIEFEDNGFGYGNDWDDASFPQSWQNNEDHSQRPTVMSSNVASSDQRLAVAEDNNLLEGAWADAVDQGSHSDYASVTNIKKERSPMSLEQEERQARLRNLRTKLSSSRLRASPHYYSGAGQEEMTEDDVHASGMLPPLISPNHSPSRAGELSKEYEDPPLELAMSDEEEDSPIAMVRRTAAAAREFALDTIDCRGSSSDPFVRDQRQSQVPVMANYNPNRQRSRPNSPALSLEEPFDVRRSNGIARKTNTNNSDFAMEEFF